MRLSVVAVAVGLVLITAACDTAVAFQRIAVSLGGGSAIQVHYLACEPERVVAVRLVDGNDPMEVEDDDVLWEIRSEGGADGGVFAVGSLPEGFVETVAFSGLDSTDDLYAAVELQSSLGSAIEFNLADLETDRVWANGDPDANREPDAFEAQARASCE